MRRVGSLHYRLRIHRGYIPWFNIPDNQGTGSTGKPTKYLNGPDGVGRHEIAGIVEKGTMKIEAKSGLDLSAEKLFGGISR
jgi:hypothetical protein